MRCVTRAKVLNSYLDSKDTHLVNPGNLLSCQQTVIHPFYVCLVQSRMLDRIAQTSEVPLELSGRVNLGLCCHQWKLPLSTLFWHVHTDMLNTARRLAGMGVGGPEKQRRWTGKQEESPVTAALIKSFWAITHFAVCLQQFVLRQLISRSFRHC